MNLKPKPLKKEIFEKARKLGVDEILLEFIGGSDEGVVRVTCHNITGDNTFDELEQEIEEWVWQVYDYSGAGDGTEYGDDIFYEVGLAVEENGTWKIPTASTDWINEPSYGETLRTETGLQTKEDLEKVYPVSKEIYDRAVELDVTRIRLALYGDKDSGVCCVNPERAETELERKWKSQHWSIRSKKDAQILQDQHDKLSQFEGQINDWVLATYGYKPFGEYVLENRVVDYDMVNKRIVVEDWCLVHPKMAAVCTKTKDMTDQMPFVSEPSDNVDQYVPSENGQPKECQPLESGI